MEIWQIEIAPRKQRVRTFWRQTPGSRKEAGGQALGPPLQGMFLVAPRIEIKGRCSMKQIYSVKKA